MSELAKVLIYWDQEHSSLVMSIERGPLEVVYCDPDGHFMEHCMATDSEFHIVGLSEKRHR
jgi:hypothetical protein